MKKALLILILTAFFVPLSYGQWVCASDYITFDHADSGLVGYINWHLAINIDTINYHHNIWQVGRPRKTVFVSAPYPDTTGNVIVTDTLHPYPPNDTSVFTLTFPGNTGWCWISELQFSYALDMDSTSIAKIEFSPDSGRSWINLADSTPTGLTGSTLLLAASTWHYWVVNINAWGSLPYFFYNDSLKFKFTFISGNDTTGKDGWMIDGISVWYDIESVPTIQNPTALTIFPNPATMQLTISSANEPITDLSITNLLGQRVRSLQSAGGRRQFAIDGRCCRPPCRHLLCKSEWRGEEVFERMIIHSSLSS